jgi:hypothetical protein
MVTNPITSAMAIRRTGLVRDLIRGAMGVSKLELSPIIHPTVDTSDPNAKSRRML